MAPLSKYDKFSVVSDEFRVRTSYGGLFSVFTLLTIIFLTYTEIQVNFSTTMHTTTHVNSTMESTLELEFDVNFPLIPCNLLYVDAADVNGQPQSLHLDKRHHVYKRRLNARGNPIGGRKKHELGGTFTSEKALSDHVNYEPGAAAGEDDTEGADPDVADAAADPEADSAAFKEEEVQCLSCYGAGDPGECCNTCEDVRRAYRQKGWTFKSSDTTIVQCAKQRQKTAAQDYKGEGCNVYGNVNLLSSGGNLHFAPGADLTSGTEGFDDESFAELLQRSFHSYNMTHTVKKLHFGNVYPGSINQLDGTSRTVGDGHAMYQYYLQVVPTEYNFLKNSRKLTTNQFSVTEHLRHVSPGSGRGLPGLYFYYEVSPLHVKYQETRRGWLGLITSIACVCGGVFSFMQMVDSFIFNSGKADARLG
jgi:hypothetical protein